MGRCAEVTDQYECRHFDCAHCARQNFYYSNNFGGRRSMKKNDDPKAVRNANKPFKRRFPRDFVGALDKGLKIIEAFETSAPNLSLTEVARRTGLTRAAARRYLLTLVSLGYAETDGKSFRLTPRIL